MILRWRMDCILWYTVVLSEGRMGCRAGVAAWFEMQERRRRLLYSAVQPSGWEGLSGPWSASPGARGNSGSVLNQSVLTQLWRQSDRDTALHQPREHGE